MAEETGTESGTSSNAQRGLRLLPWWVAALGVAAALIASAGVTLWLLHIASHASPTQQPALRLDAIRTGLTVAAGGGGAMALLLSVRRQWLSEYAQIDREKTAADGKAHQERTAAAAELDATERRITDLYTKAVDQLGNSKAPVRLGGLYALERLAQNNPEHRQTITDVICAYLRMPYVPPAEPTAPDSEQSLISTATNPLGEATPAEELQVRLTAQRILTKHLNTPEYSNEYHWAGMALDLTGATLIDFDLNHAVVTNAIFNGAIFEGEAWFDGAAFNGVARFNGATFQGVARFDGATFQGVARFGNAAFHDFAQFDGATFQGATWFDSAAFNGDAWFANAAFYSIACFDGAVFHGDARFDGAAFYSIASFTNASFRSVARFANAVFHGNARFVETTFQGATWFDSAAFSVAPLFNGTITRGDAQRTWPPGWTVRTEQDGTSRLELAPEAPPGKQAAHS